MKKSREEYKTIKRPFKFKNVSIDVFNKLNNVLERTNLFITNIYNFIKTYYVLNKSNEKLTTDKLLDIFDILKKDKEYNDKTSKYYKFYVNIFKQIYFNPINKGEIISGEYLDQVMKNNLSYVLTSIENNIIYNHEKYINTFIKIYMNDICKEEKEYNSLIKKCSIYESYKNISSEILEELKKQDKFKVETLQKLINEINKYEKIKHMNKTKNNIFTNKLKEIKEYENKFNKIKSNIKKILTNEKNIEITEIPNKFHQIFELKHQIIPINNNNYTDELSENPFNFIQSLIFMNNYFENNGNKTYNVFPSRSNVIPKHITLDTASINVIFCKNRYKSIENFKQEIYENIFKFPKSYFRIKNYVFSGTIQTDGISLSLLYLPKDQYEKKKELNNKKHEAKRNAFDYKKEINECKSIITSNTSKIKKLSKKKENKEEISLLNKEITKMNNKILDIQNREKQVKKEKDQKKKEKDKTRKEQEKEEKNKYKQYIDKLKKENNTDELKKIERKNSEFYYITQLTNKELNELKISKKLYIDQGKTELIYVLNGGNDKFMNYSGKERGKTIKTKKHMNKINDILEKNGINKEYEKLKTLNKKTTNENLIKTMEKINEINYKVYDSCKIQKLRKEKLEMYIDKQKAEAQMINKMVKQLGIKDLNELKEYTIIIGDWKGNNNLKNSKSTLGIRMKRTLSKYVKKLYLLDEYNTSKISNLNYKLYGNKEKEEQYLTINPTFELTSTCKENKEIKIINKQLHGILMFKTEKKHIPCKYLLNEEVLIQRYIQRDKNAVLNFRTIVLSYLNTGDIPLAFKRNNGGR